MYHCRTNVIFARSICTHFSSQCNQLFAEWMFAAVHHIILRERSLSRKRTCFQRTNTAMKYLSARRSARLGCSICDYTPKRRMCIFLRAFMKPQRTLSSMMDKHNTVTRAGTCRRRRGRRGSRHALDVVRCAILLQEQPSELDTVRYCLAALLQEDSEKTHVHA